MTTTDEVRYPVVAQKWSESERGWGQRPDGVSLHLSNSDRKQYIDEYWSGMPQEVPNTYSRPAGTPTVIDVGQELYEQVKVSKNGIRLYKHQIPKEM